MMDRLERIDPEWVAGANYFNLAIYYHALPAVAGGDGVKSEKYLKKAKALGESRTLFLWGTAKHINSTYGNRKAVFANVNAVLAMPLTSTEDYTFVDPYAWRVYFRRDANQLIKSN
jgi:hypothetical protein